MSSSFFKSHAHYIDSSYIRQYPHALSGDEEDTLKIAVKQYIPLDNLEPGPGDVTLIGAHANGVSKELYEPLWDDLLQATRHSDAFKIRSIWMADVAWQGESGVLNEDKIGDDPSWYDHPRDLLHFINVFRKQLPRPLVGVGHSMGGNHVVNVALMHPRLLSGLILIDPVIQPTAGNVENFSSPAILSTFRRDIWPNRGAADASFRRNKFYQSFDPRCFDNWVKYGLRELPTAVHPNDEHSAEAKSSARQITKESPSGSTRASPVTLTTTKYQEVFTFARGKYPRPGVPLEEHKLDLRTHPDVPPEMGHRPFYRSEPIMTFRNLPHLRPPVLFVFASDRSDMSRADLVKERLDATGSGLGGSGGMAAGAVQSVDIKNAGHFVPFEKPTEVAEHMNLWLDNQLTDWKRHEEADRKQWAAVPDRQKKTFTKERLYWVEQTRKTIDDEHRAARSKSPRSDSKL